MRSDAYDALGHLDAYAAHVSFHLVADGRIARQASDACDALGHLGADTYLSRCALPLGG